MRQLQSFRRACVQTMQSSLTRGGLRAALTLAAAGALLAGCETASLMGGGRGAVVAQPAAPVQPSAPQGVLPGGQGANAGVASASGKIRVAMLLPEKHPEKGIQYIAQSLKDAATLAQSKANAVQLDLRFYDTGATPETAAAGAQRAIKDGAELLLGPLMAADVRAVAPIAAEKNVPVVAFSNDRSVAGNGVFLLSIPLDEEVRRIVSTAVAEGRNRFVALVPDSRYGAGVEAAFQKEVMAAGKELVAIERYREDPQALDAAVKKISRLKFDALFLPDGGTMLRSLAPILFHNQVQSGRVRFLGTGKWHDPTVAQEAALIGGWYVVPPQEQRQSFIKSYRETFGSEPHEIASLAYDAVALTAALSGGEKGKRYSIQTITDPNGFAGTDGIFRFLPDGLTERGLAVMEIQPQGALKTVSPAPTSFQSLGM